MLSVTQLAGFGAGGSGLPVAGYKINAGSAVSSSVFTFADLDIGESETPALLVIFVGHRGNSGITVTVNGVTAERIEDANVFSGITTRCALYTIPRPAGNLITVEVTPNSPPIPQCAIGVWSLTGLNSFTPTQTQADADAGGASVATTIDIEKDGVVISGGLSSSAGAAVWTNSTERYDNITGTSGSDYTATAAETNRVITFDPVNGDIVMCSAAFR